MTDLRVSRRGALLGLAGAAGASAFAGAPIAARAEAPLAGVSRPTFYRFKLGGFEVTTLLDGAVQLPGPHPIFGQDQDAGAVADLAEANFLPADQMEIGFTVTIVNTGNEVILFDTGNGPGDRRPAAGQLYARLADAGLSPEQIDVVVLTHFHPDHIGGLMEDGAPAFPNARYVTNAVEYDFWSAEDKLSGGTERVARLTQSNVAPLAEKMSFIKPGEDVVSGVTAVDGSGHTPGHTVYNVESEGRRLMVTADVANHYVVSLQKPEWHVRFDMDKEAAGQARKQVFGMIAADRIPFVGYHMPFPAVGYVEPLGDGFRFVPASYQLNL
ncbi:MAG: MBL fold metallo-hydrolase [Pseudomonadota bacterium]